MTSMLITLTFLVTQLITKRYTGLVEKDWLIRTLQTGIENTNQLLKNLSRLLKKRLGSFVWVSAVERQIKLEVWNCLDLE